MKIRLLSDLHLEFYPNPDIYKGPEADVLVIAGDLHVGADACWSALKRFADHYERVLYCPGNHECYDKSSLQEFDAKLKQFSDSTRIHYLNPGFVKIGNINFIGASLWTNFRKDKWAKQICASRINDFRLIKNLTTDQAVDTHERHIKFIQEAYSQLEGKKVIFTHFLPAIECIAPEYQGPDLLNYYFASDYGDYISTLKDTTWMFAHTHTPTDIMLGDTRLVANPYGYNKNNDYKECILEI